MNGRSLSGIVNTLKNPWILLVVYLLRQMLWWLFPEKLCTTYVAAINDDDIYGVLQGPAIIRTEEEEYSGKIVLL